MLQQRKGIRRVRQRQTPGAPDEIIFWFEGRDVTGCGLAQLRLPNGSAAGIALGGVKPEEPRIAGTRRNCATPLVRRDASA